MGSVGSDIESIWSSSKDDSLAGQVVKLADMLCVISYCTQEMELGNRSLQEIRNECINLIRDTIEDTQLIYVAEEAISASDDIWNSGDQYASR